MLPNACSKIIDKSIQSIYGHHLKERMAQFPWNLELLLSMEGFLFLVLDMDILDISKESVE